MDIEISQQFRDLANRWHRETDHLSNPTDIMRHEAYLKIVALGPAAIPFILRELEGRGGQWYSALRILTDANPVPREHWGYVKLMKDDWLDWGRRHNYIDAKLK